MRLRAHWNSRVQVVDLADTEGPVTESNCIEAIPPDGEHVEVKHQSVTVTTRRGDRVNSIWSAVLATLRANGEARTKQCGQR